MRQRKLESDFQLNEIFEIETESHLSDDESSDLFVERLYDIGWIIMLFNSLEGSVNYAVDKALDPHERRSEINHLLICEMNYSSKVSFIIRHYGMLIYNDEKYKDFIPELEILEKKLRDAGTTRNIYAHANYGMTVNENYIRVKTKAKRNGVFYDYMRFEKEDIKEDQNLILNARNLLEDFDQKFWDKIFCC
ncbi:hypothetical protein [Flavobacterium koreense]